MVNENNLLELPADFKCLACGKRRPHMEINTFKHPLVGKESIIIIGYHHFNYCYDNLICYTKAARKERYKDGE